MRELRSERRRGLWIVLEMFGVVLSILIAFALDAWWDARVARRELDEDLLSVGREVEANAEAIRSAVSFRDQIVETTDTLLFVLSENQDRQQVAITDTLVYLAIASPRPSLSFGALEALTGAGRLASIDDVDLRLFLAGFRERYADAIEEELLARDVSYTRLRPLRGLRATRLA